MLTAQEIKENIKANWSRAHRVELTESIDEKQARAFARICTSINEPGETKLSLKIYINWELTDYSGDPSGPCCPKYTIQLQRNSAIFRYEVCAMGIKQLNAAVQDLVNLTDWHRNRHTTQGEFYIIHACRS